MTNTHKVLTAARALIAKPGKWTQDRLAGNHDGIMCDFQDGAAYQFCMLGAVMRAASEIEPGAAAYHLSGVALGCLRNVIGNGLISDFNDDPDRTHDEVLAAFDRAIANTR